MECQQYDRTSDRYGEGNMEKEGRYSMSNFKGTMGVLKTEKQDKAMLHKLEVSNVIWDWNVPRKSFRAKLRPKGRMSRSVSAGQSDTDGQQKHEVVVCLAEDSAWASVLS